MFQLSLDEAAALRSQTVILDKGRGRYSKYAPLAFTEHGVAMLAAVLNSQRAAQMSILIVRAFVKMRELLASHKDLAARVEKLEAAQKEHDSIIGILAEEIDEMKRLPEPPKRRIGLKTNA
jgi:phage regulator Rha-like protein